MHCNSRLRRTLQRAARPIFLLLLSLLPRPSASAQVVTFGGCDIDLELIDLPKCSVQVKDGHLYVLKGFAEYVISHRHIMGVAAEAVVVEGRHLACANLPGAGWAYFDRTGRVLVQNVATMDNGADPFYHGLVRVTKDNKWGLADVKGRLVVPLTYDGIIGDEKGWIACSGCQQVTAGEHSWLSGGAWYRLGRHGQVLGKTIDPNSRSIPN